MLVLLRMSLLSSTHPTWLPSRLHRRQRHCRSLRYNRGRVTETTTTIIATPTITTKSAVASVTRVLLAPVAVAATLRVAVPCSASASLRRRQVWSASSLGPPPSAAAVMVVALYSALHYTITNRLHNNIHHQQHQVLLVVVVRSLFFVCITGNCSSDYSQLTATYGASSATAATGAPKTPAQRLRRLLLMRRRRWCAIRGKEHRCRLRTPSLQRRCATATGDTDDEVAAAGVVAAALAALGDDKDGGGSRAESRRWPTRLWGRWRQQQILLYVTAAAIATAAAAVVATAKWTHRCRGGMHQCTGRCTISRWVTALNCTAHGTERRHAMPPPALASV